MEPWTMQQLSSLVGTVALCIGPIFHLYTKVQVQQKRIEILEQREQQTLSKLDDLTKTIAVMGNDTKWIRDYLIKKLEA